MLGSVLLDLKFFDVKALEENYYLTLTSKSVLMHFPYVTLCLVERNIRYMTPYDMILCGMI